MADHTNHSYIRETERKADSGGLYLIVGGVVVAVAFILWLVFGNTASTTTDPAAPAPAVTNETTIAPDAAPAEPAAPADPAAPPATAPAETQIAPDAAPAEPAAPEAAPAEPAAPATPAPAP